MTLAVFWHYIDIIGGGLSRLAIRTKLAGRKCRPVFREKPGKCRGNANRMKQASRDREITDLPSIRLGDGKHFLGISDRAWRKKWDEVYQFVALHWETTYGVRVNLESLVVAVYPDTEKDTLARTMIAHSFMWEVQRERRERRLERAQKRAEKLARIKDGGGT